MTLIMSASIACRAAKSGRVPHFSLSPNSKRSALRVITAAVGIRILCAVALAEFDACVFFTKSSISASEVDNSASNVSTNVMTSFLARATFRPAISVKNVVNSVASFICDRYIQENNNN